jgi:hypothetical protein
MCELVKEQGLDGSVALISRSCVVLCELFLGQGLDHLGWGSDALLWMCLVCCMLGSIR